MKLDREKGRKRVTLVLIERASTVKLKRETREGLKILEDKNKD